MQKLFNLMSVAAFTMSTGMVIGTAALYTRIPSITERYINDLKTELTGMVTDMLPGQVDELMPELPTETGPAMPIKSPF